MPTLELPSDSGTENKETVCAKHGTLLFTICILTLISFSCAIFRKNPPPKSGTPPSENNSGANSSELPVFEIAESSVSQGGNAVGAESSKEGPKPLRHPPHPNAWNTRLLVMTNILPPENRLLTCKAELDTLSRDALNIEDMVSRAKKIRMEVEVDPVLYHWCFYKTMTALDEMLETDNLGNSWDKKYHNFLLTMRGLWLLGGALDSSTRKNRYLSYLRKRNIELSNQYFGRGIDIIGTSFDEYLKNPGLRKEPKPASEFIED
ncbi:MAG: hypothetical protein HQK54_04510 [Oligoflexales bacterium]|nr:hypothetical protein [Oligoflexales bacterium]